MPTAASFDYETFKALSNSELVEYMERIIYDASLNVPSGILDTIISELDSFDEYHLVYAIELLARQRPEESAAILPRFLAHDKQAVRLSAERLLMRLPSTYVSTEVLDEVRSAVSQCPEGEHMKELLISLEGRVANY